MCVHSKMSIEHPPPTMLGIECKVINKIWWHSPIYVKNVLIIVFVLKSIPNQISVKYRRSIRKSFQITLSYLKPRSHRHQPSVGWMLTTPTEGEPWTGEKREGETLIITAIETQMFLFKEKPTPKSTSKTPIHSNLHKRDWINNQLIRSSIFSTIPLVGVRKAKCLQSTSPFSFMNHDEMCIKFAQKRCNTSKSFETQLVTQVSSRSSV